MRLIIDWPLRTFTFGIVVFALLAVGLLFLMLLLDIGVDQKYSHISDTLSAIANVSVSVAGSLVAIVLAVWAIQQARLTHALEEKSQRLEEEARAREVANGMADGLFLVLRDLRLSGEKLQEEASELSLSLGEYFQSRPVGAALLSEEGEKVRLRRNAAANALEDFAGALARAARDPLFEGAAVAKERRKAGSSAESVKTKSTFEYISVYLDELEANQLRLVEAVETFREQSPESVLTVMEMEEQIEAEDERLAEQENTWCLGADARMAANWNPSPEAASATAFCGEWKHKDERLAVHAAKLFEIAETLRFTELDTLWLRQAYARYVWNVQRKAALDRGGIGAYMMRTSPDRGGRFRRGSPRISERKGGLERDLRKSSYSLLKKTDKEFDSGVAGDPLLRLSLLSDGVFPLRALKATVSTEGDLEFDLPGSGTFVGDYEQLPTDPLSLNHMAHMLAAAISSLPSAEDFLNAFGEESLERKHLSRHMQPEILSGELRSIMRDFSNYLRVFPDKVFMPVWPSHVMNAIRKTDVWSDFSQMARDVKETDTPPSQAGSLQAIIRNRTNVRIRR